MTCILCKNNASIEFLDLGNQPLANKYPKPEGFAEERFFPMQVFFCPDCRNVQLGELVSRELMFENYYYLSSVNQGLVRHFDTLAEQLKDKQFVVDIGSNDGILLRPLKKLGVKALGVEPSVNVSKIANDEGLTTLTSFFDAPTVEKIVGEHGTSDAIICSSVFTHLEDPHQVIEDVKNLITDEGVFIIEVEYLGDIVKNVQFERFYFDRPFYYSLTSLAKLFASHEMKISDVKHIEPHGGSLQVHIQKESASGTSSKHVTALLAEEASSLTLPKLTEFKETAARYVTDFKKKLEAYKAKGVKVAGYSAPARVSTITNYGGIGTDLIPFIVDDSPLKQGRTSPGKHIPIVPKERLDEEKPDLLVVFAYEYLEDIKKKTGNAYRYLIPIPPREA